jgi:arylsulfatase A-like enzyme
VAFRDCAVTVSAVASPTNAPLGVCLRHVALLLPLALACAREAPPPARPNLLLVSIDTLRADHLGCYGYPRNTSPVIDQLAEHSLRFADAHAPTPWTLPSHAAMLTGSHPLDLRILDKSGTLPADVTTVAEPLRASGYQTAAFVDSGPRGLVGGERGFGRGFERYVHTQEGSGERFRYDMRHTVDAALAWLGGRDPRRPFFLFLHTKSVHSSADGQDRHSDAPYDKPEPYRTRFLAPGGQRFSWRPEPPGDVGYLRQANLLLATGKLDPTAYPRERIDELIAFYDGGIFYVDEQIGRLLGELERLGVREDTVVVLTSDHGEAFLEHHFFLHQELYHPLVHVPLILHDPRSERAASVERTVYLEDVAPTLLELAGAPRPKGMSGHSLLAEDPGSRAPRYTYFRLSPGRDYEAYGVEEGPWLLVHHKTAADPAFRSELVAHEGAPAADSRERAAIFAGLEARLLARFGPILARAPAEQPLDAETHEELRALGYVE